MGHSHSSAQLSSDREVLFADRGPARVAPPRRQSCDSLTIYLTLARFVLAALRVYQALLAPILGGACKFYPSCSHYAYEAIERHGAGRGLRLALCRLARCQPFTRGGYDPVPEIEETSR